jgi:hypothetical protein
MRERLLIAVGLLVVSGVVAWVVAWAQRRRATVAAAQDGPWSVGAAVASEGGEGEGVRVLYFRSDQCVSCATQSRLWEQLDETTRQRIETVDVDAEPERAAAYGVLTLPTSLIIDGMGDVVRINYGVVPPRKLTRQLEEAG